MYDYEGFTGKGTIIFIFSGMRKKYNSGNPAVTVTHLRGNFTLLPQ
jgi:hypothetical protein